MSTWALRFPCSKLNAQACVNLHKRPISDNTTALSQTFEHVHVCFRLATGTLPSPCGQGGLPWSVLRNTLQAKTNDAARLMSRGFSSPLSLWGRCPLIHAVVVVLCLHCKNCGLYSVAHNNSELLDHGHNEAVCWLDYTKPTLWLKWLWICCMQVFLYLHPYTYTTPTSHLPHPTSPTPISSTTHPPPHIPHLPPHILHHSTSPILPHPPHSHIPMISTPPTCSQLAPLHDSPPSLFGRRIRKRPRCPTAILKRLHRYREGNSYSTRALGIGKHSYQCEVVNP